MDCFRCAQGIAGRGCTGEVEAVSGILEKLSGGDRRSIGRAAEVVADMLGSPSLFAEVFEGMLDEDPLIRMRSADVIEKVSARHPEYLGPFKSRLIGEVSKIEQQEVRWHVAQMFSYIETNKKERDVIVRILLSYIENDESKIVKTFSMQTLADFAQRDEQLRPKVVRLIERLMRTGSPAVKSRARKLLGRLKKS
ncbi:MAG: hypothetical protein ACYS29_06805 [Planctomycetota bacterium]